MKEFPIGELVTIRCSSCGEVNAIPRAAARYPWNGQCPACGVGLAVHEYAIQTAFDVEWMARRLEAEKREVERRAAAKLEWEAGREERAIKRRKAKERAAYDRERYKNIIKPAARNRLTAIFEMRMLGKTYKEIGNEFGITRSRAKQIFMQAERRLAVPKRIWLRAERAVPIEIDAAHQRNVWHEFGPEDAYT